MQLGTIYKVGKHGVFVEYEEGDEIIKGFVHRSTIKGHEKDDLRDVCKKGEKMVVSFDSEDKHSYVRLYCDQYPT